MKFDIDDRNLVAVVRWHNVPKLYGRGWIDARKRLPESQMVLGIIMSVAGRNSIEKEGTILYRMGLVHFNALANKWQEEQDWVEVDYWLALPEWPRRCQLKPHWPLPKDVHEFLKKAKKDRSLKWIRV